MVKKVKLSDMLSDTIIVLWHLGCVVMEPPRGGSPTIGDGLTQYTGWLTQYTEWLTHYTGWLTHYRGWLTH